MAPAFDAEPKLPSPGVPPNVTGEAREVDEEPEQEFDPLRFGIVELPAGMRQNLIATKLPLVPKEQLFDTHPPHRAPSAEANLAARESWQVDAPALDELPLRSRKKWWLWSALATGLLLGVVAASQFGTKPKPVAPPLPSEPPSAVAVKPATASNATTSVQPSVPKAVPPIETRDPVRTHGSKDSQSAARPRQSPAPSPPPVSQVPPKPSGLDAAEFPKPD